jgi:hypothetical protein
MFLRNFPRHRRGGAGTMNGYDGDEREKNLFRTAMAYAATG